MSIRPINNQSGKQSLILVTAAATALVGRSIVEQLIVVGYAHLRLKEGWRCTVFGVLRHLALPRKWCCSLACGVTTEGSSLEKSFVF